MKSYLSYLKIMLILLFSVYFQACQGNPPAGGGDTGGASSSNQVVKKDTSTNKNTSEDKEESTGDESASSSDGSMDFLSALLGGGKQTGSGSATSGGEKVDPTKVTYISSRQSAYVTGKLNLGAGELMDQLYHTNDAYFHCPGDAFLIGLNAIFDPEEDDRRFSAVCHFFESADKKPMKKTSCKTTSKPYNTPGLMTANFSCEEGSFLAGLRASFDEVTKDRLISFECCQMNSWDNKPVKFVASDKSSAAYMLCNERINADRAQMDREGKLADMINDEVNPVRQELKFQCRENTMLKTISSNYISGNHDRRYSFRCCELQVTSK